MVERTLLRQADGNGRPPRGYDSSWYSLPRGYLVGTWIGPVQE